MLFGAFNKLKTRVTALETNGAPAGSITNTAISASAAIALSKLANVAVGTAGLSAGTVQATFQALATRIQALEDA